MDVKIKRLDPRAKLPTYGSADAAGADLYALIDETLTIPPHDTELIPTGLSVEIPQGHVGLIFARSSLGTKRGLAPANKVGVIDADYRGQIMVSLHNHTDEPQTLEAFERIAQLVLVPLVRAAFHEADELSETDRGEGGFGSTGRK